MKAWHPAFAEQREQHAVVSAAGEFDMSLPKQSFPWSTEKPLQVPGLGGGPGFGGDGPGFGDELQQQA